MYVILVPQHLVFYSPLSNKYLNVRVLFFLKYFGAFYSFHIKYMNK